MLCSLHQKWVKADIKHTVESRCIKKNNLCQSKLKIKSSFFLLISKRKRKNVYSDIWCIIQWNFSYATFLGDWKVGRITAEFDIFFFKVQRVTKRQANFRLLLIISQTFRGYNLKNIVITDFLRLI